MDGSFVSSHYRFQVESSDWEMDKARGFDEEFEDDAFDLRLTGSGKLPKLEGAPIASWLLARLARLTEDQLGLGDVEHNDGGGYVVEFVVYLVASEVEAENKDATVVQPLLFDRAELGFPSEAEYPVASFQLQGDMEGAGVLGEKAADCPAEKILGALAAALLAAPLDLLRRELAVKDPEWKSDPEMYRPRPRQGSRNWYGWDGDVFLGKDNIREADLSL